MESGKVLAWITPSAPWGTEQESPLDRSAQNVHIAVADFSMAIHDAKTVAEALRLHRLLSQLVMALGAMEDAALLKADDLCKPTT